jgi:anti-anti-sigma factor
VNRTTRAETPAEPSRFIELAGEYDLARKQEVESLFDSLAPGGPTTLDLSKVTYVDSTFLALLAKLHLRFKEHGVTLAGVNSAIRRILSTVHFDELFRISEAEYDYRPISFTRPPDEDRGV